jgi:nitroreductase
LLASRFSPLMFDPAWTITEEDVELLLDAARWAPSAGNSQPWAYFVARRDEPEHKRIVRHLARPRATQYGGTAHSTLGLGRLRQRDRET